MARWEQFQPPQGQRAYVQGNSIRNVNQNVGGFSQFGNTMETLGQGLEAGARGVGVLGAVIDSWGAGKRAEKEAKRANLQERVKYIPTASIQEILADEEKVNLFAEQEGFTPEEFRSELTLRSYMLAPETRVANVHNALNPQQPRQEYYDDPANQALMEAPVEGSAQPDSPPGQMVDPSQESGEVQEPGTPEGAPPQGPEPVDYDAIMKHQMEVQSALEEADNTPSTYDLMEAEATQQNSFVPKQSSPQVVEAAQRRMTQATLNAMDMERKIGAVLSYQMEQGMELDPTKALAVAAMQNQSVEAKAEAIKAMAVAHLDYYPFEYKEWFENPIYYDTAIKLERARLDPKYAESIAAEIPEMQEFLRGAPPVWGKIYGKGIQGTAAHQAQQGHIQHEEMMTEKKQTLEEKKQAQAHLISKGTLGLQRDQFELLKTKTTHDLGMTENDFKLKVQQEANKQYELNRQYDLTKFSVAQANIQTVAKLAAAPFTNKNIAYQTIKDLGNMEQQTAGGKLLADVLQMETDLALAVQSASAKHAPRKGGDLANGAPTSVQSAAEVQQMQQILAQKRQELEKVYGSHGVMVMMRNGDQQRINVMQDLGAIRKEILNQLGYESEASVKAARQLEDLARGMGLQPDRLGAPIVPQQLKGVWEAAESRGFLLPAFESPDSFKVWLKRYNIPLQDADDLWVLHQDKVRELQERQQTQQVVRGQAGMI